jgi:hypothetical protein
LHLLLDKGAKFLLGGLLGLIGFARPRLVGAAFLWLDGLAFSLELLGPAALFSGVTVVPAMHLAEVGVVRITIAVAVVATILLLGRLLLVVAIVHDGALLQSIALAFSRHSMKSTTSVGVWSIGSQFCSSILTCQLLGVAKRRMLMTLSIASIWLTPKGGKQGSLLRTMLDKWL